MRKRCLLILFFLINSSYCSFLEWLGFRDNSPPVIIRKVPLVSIPFEELDPDERFLLEASKIIGMKLDELDVCQQKLVIKLKSSCGELSDEELSKLAVGLLNCQSDIEGRKVFPCTPSMSLRECTKDMDPDVWNSYHVVSNRARAVCYAMRQDQFRALAEITINKLMSVTQDHIDKMSHIEEQQVQLMKASEAILSRLLQSHTNVLSSYGNIKKSETSLLNSIMYGINKMENQKELLSKLEEMIALMMEKLYSDLGNYGHQLSERMASNIDQHQVLQRSLLQHNKTASLILQKLSEFLATRVIYIQESLEESNTVLEKNEIEILAKSHEAIVRLQTINDSLNNMTNWIKYFENVGQPRFHHIKDLIGEEGGNLDLAVLLIGHICCLLLAMLICSFLSVPFTSRWLLCLAAPINIYLAASKNLNEYSTSLFIFYTGVFIIVLGDYCGRVLYTIFLENTFPKTTRNNLSNNINNTSFNLQNKFVEETNHLRNVGDINYKVNSWLSGRHTPEKNGHSITTYLANRRKKADDDGATINSELSLTKRGGREAASGSTGGSSGTRSRCTAICRSGEPCKNQVYWPSTLCRVHGRGSTEPR